MAARPWNPFSCCVVGGVGVADYNDDCSTSWLQRKDRSLRMSSTSLSLSPEELSRTLTLSGLTLHPFTYAELRAATGIISPANFLGRGGFGPVYKGTIDDEEFHPTQVVAVKCLDLDCATQGHREWLAEVLFLGQLRHENLMKLIGYCYEDEHRMLVYEFMTAGSLESHLFKSIISGSLPWMARMKIALGAAKGLAFLHDNPAPVIYRDFQAANILLDSDYNTKLSDFGLVKDGPTGDETHVTTRIMGTHGYAAPEYITTGHLTAKSDVYSFGVVLLELLSGRRCVDRTRQPREQYLVDWARSYLKRTHKLYRVMDPSLECQFSCKGAEVVALVAYTCLSLSPQSRPTMKEVVKALDPMLAMEDFYDVIPFVFTVTVDEDKVVDMMVEVKEKQHNLHHHNHRAQHRQKYPNSAIHADIMIHSHDGYIGAQHHQQRLSRYHRVGLRK